MNDQARQVQWRNNRALAVVWVSLLLLLPTNNVRADSFRCGLKVVRNGDAQSDLIRACGEPQRKDSAQERVGSGSSQKTVRVQRWFYKNSGRRLERMVLLHEGKVVGVKIAGR
jgi:hypothetical protein